MKKIKLKNNIKLTPLQEAINFDRSKIMDFISQHISYDTEIKEEQQEDQEDDQDDQIQFKCSYFHNMYFININMQKQKMIMLVIEPMTFDEKQYKKKN
ncbi:hypothetical protein pb186bvf_002611 [Paramecium bursaria]